MNQNLEEMKEASRVNITLAENNPTAEVMLRYGEAPALLEPKEPIKLQLVGTLNSPTEFLAKRLKTGQIDVDRSHIKVDREEARICLTVNENDAYNVGTVTGAIEFNPKFNEFGINRNVKWTPIELGMFLKLNRPLFKDKAENMKLVTELMNFTATINNKVERSVKENGSNTDNFAQVVNSNLPNSFKVYMPLIKGGKKEEIEVETMATIDGREVSFVLISPGAVEAIESVIETAIDRELDEIRKIAPGLVIIEV